MKRALLSARNILLFVLWLGVMLLPCFALTLAARGELSWQRSEYDSDRVWLIQEREQRGLGYAAIRVSTDNRATGGPLCVRNTVRFVFWKGEANNENNDWCECYGADGKVVTTVCK